MDENEYLRTKHPGHKITQSQCNGVNIDKWYIRPNFVYIGSSNRDVCLYFGCTRSEYNTTIIALGGIVEDYRSGFPTKEAAEEGVEILTSIGMIKKLIL